MTEMQCSFLACLKTTSGKRKCPPAHDPRLDEAAGIHAHSDARVIKTVEIVFLAFIIEWSAARARPYRHSTEIFEAFLLPLLDMLGVWAHQHVRLPHHRISGATQFSEPLFNEAHLVGTDEG